jgi:hypothetical protein
MPHGMSQCANATVVGRSQLVRRDMGLPRFAYPGRWPVVVSLISATSDPECASAGRGGMKIRHPVFIVERSVP